VANAGNWSLRPIEPAELDWAFALQVAVMGGYIAESWGWDEQAHRAIFDQNIVGDSLQVIEVAGHRAGLLRADEHPTELLLEIMELSPRVHVLAVRRPHRGAGRKTGHIFPFLGHPRTVHLDGNARWRGFRPRRSRSS
jgi:hypothetical protein